MDMGAEAERQNQRGMLRAAEQRAIQHQANLRNNDPIGLADSRARAIGLKVSQLPNISETDSETLQSFCSMVTTLHNTLYSIEEREYLVAELKFKLAGVSDLPNNVLENCQTWEDMQLVLRRQHSETNTRAVLKSRLSALAQKPGENIEQFGNRARRVLRQLENHYGDNLNVPLLEKLTEEVTEQFRKNIRSNRLRDAVRLSGSRTSLLSCVQFAIEQEASLREEEPDYELHCSYCGKAGHRLQTCPSRDKDIITSNALAGNAVDRQCNRCNAHGHSANLCRVKIIVPGVKNYENNNNDRNQNNGRSNNYNNGGNSRNSNGNSNQNIGNRGDNNRSNNGNGNGNQRNNYNRGNGNGNNGNGNNGNGNNFKSNSYRGNSNNRYNGGSNGNPTKNSGEHGNGQNNVYPRNSQTGSDKRTFDNLNSETSNASGSNPPTGKPKYDPNANWELSRRQFQISSAPAEGGARPKQGGQQTAGIEYNQHDSEN